MQEDDWVEDYLGAGMKGLRRSYRVVDGRQAACKKMIIRKVGHWRQDYYRSLTLGAKMKGSMFMNILVAITSEKNIFLPFFFLVHTGIFVLC